MAGRPVHELRNSCRYSAAPTLCFGYEGNIAVVSGFVGPYNSIALEIEWRLNDYNIWTKEFLADAARTLLVR
jgi:hypothetical protein